ncbi:MAG: hypothetical protein WC975_08070 [Phycisphaerae bacterium]
MEPVHLAIVGVDRYTEQILTCLEKSDRVKLCAVCDTHPPLLNMYREKYPEIHFYDDPREMVLREKPGILLLWRDCCKNEFLDSVIEKGCCPVLRSPTIGGLGGAMRLIRQAEKNNSAIFVWTPWLFFPGYQCVQDWIGDAHIRSINCRSATSLADLELPAENNLLSAGMYSALFLTHKWLTLPSQVYCREIFSSAQSTEKAIQYFAQANLVYSHALASITVAVNAGPPEDEIFLTANTGQVRLEPTQSKFFDCSGNPIAGSQKYELTEARQIAYNRHFEHIWQSIIEHQKSTDFELKRHLGVLAILEAAALSARTGHPEQLAKIINFHNIAAYV